MLTKFMENVHKEAGVMVQEHTDLTPLQQGLPTNNVQGLLNPIHIY
jgi:hypothetical protein